MQSANTLWVMTQQGMGVTIEERLGEETIATNKALSVSTATHRDKVKWKGRCYAGR